MQRRPSASLPPRIRLAWKRPPSGLAPDVRVLGSRVHLLDRERVLDRLEGWIEERPVSCRQVVVTGFHGIWEASRDPALKQVLNSAALWVPDGIAPVWLGRIHGHKHIERLPGADLMTGFFDRAKEKGYRSFFYGSTEPNLQRLRREVERRWPGHEWAGSISPPFRPCTPEEDEAFVRQINAAKPDVLWVCLGLPKQERWIHAHLHRLDVPLAIGVGAAFSFLSGEARRAPKWLGEIGLEWAFRLTTTPSRTWRRALLQGPHFVVQAFSELMGIRRYDYRHLESGEAFEKLRRPA